jgi:glyoxylase-like metal-dependent hydrolase (beta-lactamase superfamily II)
MSSPAVPLGPGLRVFERGWLSSNNILLDDDEGATLVDTGHSAHAAQTLALLEHALGGRPLRQLINTHLHSDHCGGNAALQRAGPLPLRVPAGSLRAVQEWDEQALSYRPLGQRCERFAAQGSIAPGERLRIGRRTWQVLASPGHDPHSVMLFDAAHGVLISADALWENGFGLIFPELEGESAFDDQQQVLDLIATLPVRCVVPGHGAPFTDVDAALRRARERLAAFRAEPARHLRHGANLLLKYHLMEEREQPVAALRDWLCDTPLLQSVWCRLGRPRGSQAAWADELLQQMLDRGLLRRRGDTVCDA